MIEKNHGVRRHQYIDLQMFVFEYDFGQYAKPSVSEQAKNKINSALRQGLNFNLPTNRISFNLLDLRDANYFDSWCEANLPDSDYHPNKLYGNQQGYQPYIFRSEHIGRLIYAINAVLEIPTKATIDEYFPLSADLVSKPSSGDLERHLETLRKTKEALEKGLKIMEDNPDINMHMDYHSV